MADWSYRVSTVSLGLAALNASATPPSAFTVAGGGRPMEVKQPVIDQRHIDQSIALSEARSEARVNDLKGDVRVVSEGLNNLKSRFDDLSARMATVPADIAAMKRDIAHLPTKDELGAKLRNYLAMAVGSVAIVNAAITWGPKLLGH